MSAPTRIYCPVSPDEITNFRAELLNLGCYVPAGFTGTFKPPGHPEITLGLSYDGTSKLTITILDDTWYETASEIWNALDKYMPPSSVPAS